MSAHNLLDAPRSDCGPLALVPRRLVVTWQHPHARRIHPVGFLDFDGHGYEFRYMRNALTVLDFRPLIGFPDLERAYSSEELFPLFAQRAMDPRRPDFVRYVTRLGLQADTSPWEQIARSGGRRAGDSLQLFPVPTVRNGEMTCSFLVHGVRHIGSVPLALVNGPRSVDRSDVEIALGRLQPGEELGLLPEPGNSVNSKALLVTSDGVPVGYIPDMLLDDLASLREMATLRAFVEVVNGPEAPWHLRLLGRLQADDVGEFCFFTGESWEPLTS